MPECFFKLITKERVTGSLLLVAGRLDNNKRGIYTEKRG